MGTIISRADVEGDVPPRDFIALFDRDRDGAVTSAGDLAFLDGRIAVGESTLTMRTRAAFPLGFTAAPGTADPAIKDAAIAFTLHASFNGSSLATGATASPYRQRYLDAVDFCKHLSNDQGMRPATAATPVAEPQAYVDGDTTTYDTPSSPWRRAADGDDASAY